MSVLAPYRLIDRQLCLALLLLAAVGMVTLYSLSFADRVGFSSGHFVRHCVYVGSALVLFGLILRVPLYFWRGAMPWLLGITLLLCYMTLLFAPTKGAARWINLFGLSVQVSELFKFTSVLTFAVWGRLIVENNVLYGGNLRQISRPMLPLGGFLLLAALAMILQKDLGTILILAVTSLLVLVLAGLRWRYIILAGVIVLAIVALLVWMEPYRMERIAGFIDPFADPYGKGYAQLQSLMAYNHGGWFGVGLGNSLQKGLLPEMHNDFIIAIIAEEYGLLGFFAVCALYLFVVMRAIHIGSGANRRGELFGAFYAYTLAGLLITQVSINIGGSLAVLPSKGLTLPLVSYGGSSLWASAAMLAVLLRIDYENKAEADDDDDT